MKKLIVLLFIFSLGCSKDTPNNNPYLPNYAFSFELNLSLPSNNQLLYTGNGVYINTPGVGVRGIFVFNAGNENYVAWDAACPNQPLEACSTMTKNGVNAVCPCDDAEYSLFTGLSTGKQYAMKAYRVQKIGTTALRIYN